ncbi:rhodanese-like domain-containing protein [Grimontia sp. NTOU-MAR1]|uniref:rhodanese-like domain-containing protein n=1 Tax=Grimontia sp. NTOU-MAR1 TaxID=3111011 RepID=UPI002DB9D9C8|nr:rhodanese-like domain-containing protein [Grimontia sp. NTOU-MAR1]WRV98023.1 rhodanese-like domain-containing protein [Grimontia sp. NTOU-MAR1]
MLLTSQQFVDVIKEKIIEISPKQLSESADEVVLIDVREPQELEGGIISNSYPIPRGTLEMNIIAYLVDTLKVEDVSNAPIVLYCRSGARSALATESLKRMGFNNVSSLKGGIAQWSSAGYPLVEQS